VLSVDPDDNRSLLVSRGAHPRLHLEGPTRKRKCSCSEIEVETSHFVRYVRFFTTSPGLPQLSSSLERVRSGQLASRYGGNEKGRARRSGGDRSKRSLSSETMQGRSGPFAGAA